MAFSFNGATKIITLSSGTTSISVRDLWTAWVDWLGLSDNSKYPTAMSSVGGNDTGGGKFVPVYVFLDNGWKIRPQEASHTLTVDDGILIGSGGGDPFTDTLGNYRVNTRYSQPVQAISYSADGAGSSGPNVDDISQAVWARVIDNGLTAEMIQRVLVSILAGKVTGAGTDTEVFRDLSDSKARVTVTADESGNRSQVIIDGT